MLTIGKVYLEIIKIWLIIIIIYPKYSYLLPIEYFLNSRVYLNVALQGVVMGCREKKKKKSNLDLS